MTYSLSEVERELKVFPTTVVDDFRRSLERIQHDLREPDLQAWAQQGVDLAKQTVRSWEAASAYFTASPEVAQHLTTVQLLDWARCGSALCRESPALAAAFFHASPASMPNLRPHFIQGWADLGRTLYRGTWKSSVMAAKFFDVSGSLLQHIGYHQLEQFVQVVKLVSEKSPELATECLVLGQDMLPKIGNDRPAFIRLCLTVAQSNWRDVRGCFDSVQKVTTHLGEKQRPRLLGLAAVLAEGGMSNTPQRLSEGAISLGRVEDDDRGFLLDLAERLLAPSSESTVAFLNTGPELLGRIGQQQLEAWFETGLSILHDNHEGGLAFFKIESTTSEQVLEALSHAVELDRSKEVLRLYCRALAGASVDISTTKELMAKNIGWVSEDHATTEGTIVFLPPVVHRYNSKSDNFAMFKVLATHQVAHIEFGSFGFAFETPSAQFPDSRPAKEQEALAKRSAASLPAMTAPAEAIVPSIEDAEQASAETNGSAEAHTAFVTDMGRFFSLFDNRRLAQDVFTVVEDSRLDYRIRQEYPGLASAYRMIQQDALGERPEIEGMPLQEAMVEFLVRLSLQQNKGLPCPADYVEVAKAIEQVVRRVVSTKASVEDSAEATLRIYDLIAAMPNVEVPQEEWVEVEFDEEDLTPEELEQLLDQLHAAPGPANVSEDQQEESYESPPQVDYRGDFKPELSQLLAQLRLRQGQGGQQQQGSPLTKEMLEQLLANNPELELDAESGHIDSDLQMFVENILKSASAAPPQDPGQGYGPIPHDDDAGGSLEAKEPRTFTYDEWDFRALDYKPRWCIVREKTLTEGETTFFSDTLRTYSSMVTQIRRQFEMIMPEMFHKVKHLPDGDDFDLDAVIESIIDKWAGMSPSDKVHWRRDKIERDVAVAFLLDMSASTAEAIDESRRTADTWDTPDDPVEYMAWLRRRRGEAQQRTYKRIIDLEKESIVLLITAMETIGDVYGIYGFSGYGRENVEFYVIKDVEEAFSDRVKKRIDKIAPLHATRMGPAIRHAAAKLERQDARTKLLLLLSDGRPQDRGYSREGVEKEYAVHDTKMALIEARRKGITPFCLTVDKSGHDYLKTMCQDMGYEVLADINSLPSRLPALYRKLTF